MAIFVQLKCFAQHINVAFTIDKNYPIFTQIVIFSILENNLSKNHYNFYIVENNMTKRQKTEMQKFVEERGHSILFIHTSTDKIDKGINVYKNKFIDGRITRIGMARLLLPEILPKSVHRVIYLDSDVIVSDDIAKLYNTDLKNNPIGMVYDIYSIIVYNNPGYYNSGVILMDIDKCREEKITEEIIAYFHKKMYMFLGERPVYLGADQDLLNIVLKNRTTTLPFKWNILTNEYGPSLKNPNGIFHYIGPLKPWRFEKKTKNAYSLYYEYWDKSPLKKYKLIYYLKYQVFGKVVSFLFGNH